MRAADIEVIGAYISRWKNTTAQYIATCPILDLCLDTERRMGSRTLTRWWDQEVLVFPGRTKTDEECGDIGREGEYFGEDYKS